MLGRWGWSILESWLREVGQEQTKECVGEVGLEHSRELVEGGGAGAY